MAVSDDYYDSAALAKLLGVLPTSIHRYHSRGDIPRCDDHVGRSPVWERRKFDTWLKSRPGHGWRAGRKG